MSDYLIWALVSLPIVAVAAFGAWESRKSILSVAKTSVLTLAAMVLWHAGCAAISPPPTDDAAQECERHPGPFGC
jgi:hypothetical protein